MKNYVFIGKTTQFMKVCEKFGTIEEIYRNLIEDDIVSYDNIVNWVVENKLSVNEEQLYQSYIDGDTEYDDLVEKLYEKIDDISWHLNDDEMVDLISSANGSAYYQEWHEVDESGRYLENLKELEKVVTEKIDYFNENNFDDLYINTKLSFTNSYYEGYDLKLELEALDYEQVEQIVNFIKKLADENL